MANCLTILMHFRTSDRWEKLNRSGMELTELPPENMDDYRFNLTRFKFTFF